MIADKLNSTNENSISPPDDSILKTLDDAAKSYLYENFTIQPLSSDIPEDVLLDYQLDRVSGPSLNMFETDLDLKAFPELFPSGQYGIKDTTRTTKISTSDYIKSRLLNKNAKFRLNINYLFHSFQTQEISNMSHSIGHMLRTVTNNMSARAFYERLKNKDGEVSGNMFSLMANIRGSREYFAKLSMDVKWMIKHLGPPTLFVTCSTAEWYSEAFISYLRKINSSVPGVEKMTAAELCAMDPVNVSIHFHKKWNTIFNKLINSKDQPVFGTVEDYFWRIEYQARGAPHVHLILWIKDAPILGHNTVEEVKEYIQSIITCSMPDPEKSPTLHDLVTQFQTHKCNSYCTKTYKKNDKFYKKCRFGFPRPTKSAICMNDVIDCLAASKKKQPRKRLYHLIRNKDETQINDYNAALLLANQGNVDVQYIGHLGSRLPFYITDYMTKHERAEQDDMWHELFSSTKSLGSNAMSFALKSVKSRQVGAIEAADRLLGHKLYSKSRQHRFADLQPPNKAKRILKKAADIHSLMETNPDSDDIFYAHWVIDIYPDRPEELGLVSLYDIMSWYEKEKQLSGSNKPLQLKNLPFYLRRRKSTPYIVTHQTVNPHQSEENKEKYYYYLLKLFKPWRNESDLSIPGLTYEEVYDRESNNQPNMVKYHHQTVTSYKRDQDVEKQIQERAQCSPTVEAADEEDEEGAFAGCVTDNLQLAMHELVHVHSAATKQDKLDTLQTDYESLNVDQKRVVDRVVTAVSAEEPIRLLVSGQGGTGKSRIIDVIRRLVTAQAPPNTLRVVVAAPTGLAAYNIGGSTIHPILCLPVEHGKPPDYRGLNQDQLKTVRQTLRGLRLLIIDEVSMVSSLTLMFIHLRLTEIFCSNAHFGGLNVVFFADLLQLPPVKGNQPFIPVTFLESKQRIGAIGTLNLWEAFQYDELTINMRQRTDNTYADILSRLRIGQMTPEDCSVIKQKLITKNQRATTDEICNTYLTLKATGKSPMILLPTTILCNKINSAMLDKTGNTVYTFHAIDILETLVDKNLTNKIQQAYHKTENDTTRTAGLEKSLRLCVDARVMLKRNKDVDAGLVNGSVGTVHSFRSVENDSNNEIYSINIKFQNSDLIIPIQREASSFEVLKGIYYTRKQFPLMLAFGITVHKSQGLSLDSVIVDAGSTTFGCGMIYVALSRVTTLDGLHLIDLDETKIKSDDKAINEYNRLRKLYAPHLGFIQTTDTDRQTDAHNKQTASRNRRQVTALFPNNDTNIFQYCNIESLNNDFQQHTQQVLQLPKQSTTWPAPVANSRSSLFRVLGKLIYDVTQQPVQVTVWKVRGDGNCLFRAMSLTLTGSENNHRQLRHKITQHMLDDSMQQPMINMFSDTNSYFNHVHQMKKMLCGGQKTKLLLQLTYLTVRSYVWQSIINFLCSTFHPILCQIHYATIHVTTKHYTLLTALGHITTRQLSHFVKTQKSSNSPQRLLVLFVFEQFYSTSSQILLQLVTFVHYINTVFLLTEAMTAVMSVNPLKCILKTVEGPRVSVEHTVNHVIFVCIKFSLRNCHKFHEYDEIAKLSTCKNSVCQSKVWLIPVDHWENGKLKCSVISLQK